MAQLQLAGLEVTERLYIEKTGITSEQATGGEVEATSTSAIPAGYPSDRSFVILSGLFNWEYGGNSSLHVERTSDTLLTWYTHFTDVYGRNDFAAMIFSAQLILLASPPKSIQLVSKSIPYATNGYRALTSALPIAVDPAKAICFINSSLDIYAVGGGQSTDLEVSAPQTLTWKITSTGALGTKTLRALIIDP